MEMTFTDLKQTQPVPAQILAQTIKKDRFAHAYLFYGPQGTGKKTASLLFAMRFFCEQPVEEIEPCGECLACKRIKSGNHPDVHWIRPDGQSIKKDAIEKLKKEFTYSGVESNQKVYIVEEADRMNDTAANRLLKFLEEPNVRTLAILLTENFNAILPTIRSRCQPIHFKELSINHLLEKFQQEDLSESNARMAAALRLSLDKAKLLSSDEWFANARKIVVQLMNRIIRPNEEAYIFLHQSWLQHFQDRTQHEQGLDLLILLLKDCVYVHLDEIDKVVFIDQLDFLNELQMAFSVSQLKRFIYEILQTKRKLNMNVNPTLAMEQLVLKFER